MVTKQKKKKQELRIPVVLAHLICLIREGYLNRSPFPAVNPLFGCPLFPFFPLSLFPTFPPPIRHIFTVCVHPTHLQSTPPLPALHLTRHATHFRQRYHTHVHFFCLGRVLSHPVSISYSDH
ncbi:conserved hypothetical protein [Candida tropicalis MYA-3404]|uniref:Uncharacterized protein n=1 Tax=Candida tropicalis (strain ATCC MYA-3404 / T1) TaxID=294747 RepID=C5M208_CANTT|nr:conserved hypothetical protein [Candida tropicalis MYA-3404]EER35358.1 conserved hypothetical protein [Candida tropicalis MYA-3404]KAG4409461.1 hypothetical protein JTP64_000099 [Candida tropicalis]